jgi:hypothetical protein
MISWIGEKSGFAPGHSNQIGRVGQKTLEEDNRGEI